MKSILISIQPQWVEKILNGEKTIEIRKTKPKIELPCKVYIYCTKPKKWWRYSSCGYTSDELLWKTKDKIKMCDGFEFYNEIQDCIAINGKVVAEFTLNEVEDFSKWEYDFGALVRHLDLWAGTKGNYPFLIDYLKRQKKGYAWHIDNLKIYDTPKELSEFVLPNKNNCKTCFLYPDMCNKVCEEIKQHLFSPPQSWCYVEEVYNG